MTNTHKPNPHGDRRASDVAPIAPPLSGVGVNGVDRPLLGIALMIATTLIFSLQDGISRHLAEQYNVMIVVTIRYWFFVVLVIALGMFKQGGIRRVAKSHYPVLQVIRGLVLVTEICLAVAAFTEIGLVNFHAIFASYPLVLAALSAPFLGERVGWRRWSAITAGFTGVIIALNPTNMIFGLDILLPIGCAVLFAIYGILTRLVARHDTPETSFFWTGITGGIAVTLIAPFFWELPEGGNWLFMALLCLTSVGGHFMLIKSFAVTEASTVQPFAYFSIIFASAVGVLVFGEILHAHIIIGGSVIVAAGLFTLQRTKRVNAQPRI